MKHGRKSLSRGRSRGPITRANHFKVAANVIGAAYKGYKMYKKGKTLKQVINKRVEFKSKFNKGQKRINVGEHVVKSLLWKTTYKPTKMGKIYKKLSNAAIYDATLSWGTVTTESLQKATIIGSNIYDYNTINNIWGKMGAIYNQAGSAKITVLGGQGAATGYESLKLYIHECVCEQRIINQAPSTCEVDVYLVQSKVTLASLYNANASWNSGLVDELAGNGGNVDDQAPYSVPTQAKAFNMTWKILKKWELSLESGRQINLKWIFKPQSIIDSDYFNQYQQVRGLTHQFMLVQRGTLGDSSNSNAVGSIGLTPTKLVGSQRLQFRSSVLGVVPRTYYNTNNYTTADTNLWQINDETLGVIDSKVSTNNA